MLRWNGWPTWDWSRVTTTCLWQHVTRPVERAKADIFIKILPGTRRVLSVKKCMKLALPRELFTLILGFCLITFVSLCNLVIYRRNSPSLVGWFFLVRPHRHDDLRVSAPLCAFCTCLLFVPSMDNHRPPVPTYSRHNCVFGTRLHRLSHVSSPCQLLLLRPDNWVEQ